MLDVRPADPNYVPTEAVSVRSSAWGACSQPTALHMAAVTWQSQAHDRKAMHMSGCTSAQSMLGDDAPCWLLQPERYIRVQVAFETIRCVELCWASKATAGINSDKFIDICADQDSEGTTMAVYCAYRPGSEAVQQLFTKTHCTMDLSTSSRIRELVARSRRCTWNRKHMLVPVPLEPVYHWSCPCHQLRPKHGILVR